MDSACIRSMNLNNHRNNNLTLPSLQNNQNFILLSQTNYNQMATSQSTTSSTTMPVNTITSQKLKNLTTIAPASVVPQSTASTTATTISSSILSMNGVNIQSQQSSNVMQQSNNILCGVISSGNATTIYKKKYTYANIPYGTELPPSVARRNARERNRVKQVNNGYANLRQKIPQTIINALSNGGRGASKKLSKVDTLRLAVEYIRRLQDVLVDEGASDNGSDGGSLYGSSNLSSGTDCEGSPESTTYYHNVESPMNDNHHLHQNHINQIVGNNGSDGNSYMINQISYSDASVSPAPSYTSDISISSNNNHYLTHSPNLDQPQHNHNQNQFKFESYDNGYNSITDTTPEDEELLDYISSWQEQ